MYIRELPTLQLPRLGSTRSSKAKIKPKATAVHSERRWSLRAQTWPYVNVEDPSESKASFKATPRCSGLVSELAPDAQLDKWRLQLVVSLSFL